MRRVRSTGWLRLAVLAGAIGTASCGPGPKATASRVNPAACSPTDEASVTGFSLRADAPLLEGRWRYRCVVFGGAAGRRAEVTVFAAGFRPEVYLLDPAARPHLLAWSRTGPGSDVARVSATLPRTGAYAAVITTVEDGATGSFVVSVQDGP